MAIKRQIRSAFPRQPTRSDRSVLAVAGGLPYNAQRMLAIDKRGFFDIDQTALGTALSPNANARSLDPGIGSTLVTSILYVFNQTIANLSSTSNACQFIGPLADTATPTRPCFAMGSSTGFATGETIAVLDSTSGVTYITDNIAIGLHSLCFEWNGSDYDIWLDGVKKTTTAGTSGHAAQITMTPYVGTRIFSTQPRFCPILFAISDTEKLSRFIDTPWQVFPPEIRRLHIASGGAGGTTTEVTVLDGIYFQDPDTRQFDTSRLDGVYFDEAQIFDRMLSALDNVLLDHSRYEERLLTIVDNLFLLDNKTSVAEKLLIDLLFVYDTVVAEPTAGANVTAQTVVDNMLLLDNYIKNNDSIVSESLIFSDTSVREALKLLVDNFLLSDTLTRELGLTMVELMLLDSLRSSVIDTLLRDAPLMGDSVVALRYAAGAVLLQYAKLRVTDHLGISLGTSGYLGRTIGVKDYLGIVAQTNVWSVR